MATFTTSRTVDLDQLRAELTGNGRRHFGLVLRELENGKREVECEELDRETLRAAVAAHRPPDRSTRQANEATAQRRIDEALDVNKAFLELKTPTSGQVAAQVQALTRQQSAHFQLQLGRFDDAL